MNTPFERLVQKLEPESTLLQTWNLTGGVSAQVTALELQRPSGETHRLIVRRHGPVDLSHNPQIAAHEFRLLQLLHTAGLATPAPYYLDESGEIFPTPYLVLEYTDGTTEFAPLDLSDLLHQLATHLTYIHRLAPTPNLHQDPPLLPRGRGARGEGPPLQLLDLTFLPHQAERTAALIQTWPTTLDESLSEGRIRTVLESVWPWPQRNRSVLLHGDYWPGNILWRDGRLVAIVDWEDAALGDPLADLANTRLEILWTFGLDAMHRFTDIHRSLIELDYAALPYWDLAAALRPAGKIAEWAGDAATEAGMRARHALFIAQAFEAAPQPLP